MRFNLSFVIVISSFFLNPLLAQDFSGEIVKKSTYIAKNNTVNIDSIANNALGDVSRYFIKDGYYKNQSYKNGEPGYSYTYHANTRFMYDDQPDKNYITYRDSRKSSPSTYEEPVFHRDSTITLVGYNCYLVTQQTSFGFTKTYYSDEVRVDPESFKDHKVASWYEKLKSTDGAISLKSIVDYGDYLRITETVQVNEMELSDDFFKLPPNKKIVASFSALDERVALEEPTPENIACYRKMMRENIHLAQSSNIKKIYTRFIVTENGEITDVDVHEKDNVGLYKKAIEIIENCGFTFIPGKINGKAVASEVYFPIEFN